MKQPLAKKSFRLDTVYAAASARLEALTLRERALVVLSCLAVTWMVWDWTIERALSAKLESYSEELLSDRTQLTSELVLQQELASKQASDPNSALETEQKSLEATIAANDARLEDLVGRFVSPREMTSVLEDVVTHHKTVQLSRLINLPVEPVRLAGAGEDVPGMYRHVLHVELTGSYFDLLAYLEELETKPWKFGWRTLEYRVAEYPRAVMTMEIETLSRRTSLLGV